MKLPSGFIIFHPSATLW